VETDVDGTQMASFDASAVDERTVTYLDGAFLGTAVVGSKWIAH
jgi:hypothetical protein